MKIKAVNHTAPKFGFVPCGKCEDCRNVARSSWAYRLMAEMAECRKNGWYIGFLTLTYRESCLPHLPKELFVYPSDYVKIPCFSRSDVRNWIVNVRRKLHKVFRVAGFKYMVVSEYGSETHRPHYHVIFAFPPVNWNKLEVFYDGSSKLLSRLKRIDYPKYVYSVLKGQWKFGFTIPCKFDGGFDRKGKFHRPFLVENDTFAAQYAAKYCCKDLDQLECLKSLDLRRSTRLFKNCMSFHAQSRSLGLSSIQNLTDQQKIDLYLKGRSFVGVDVVLPPPLYLKNKLIFDINYVYEDTYDDSGRLIVGDDGVVVKKRLIRRKANQFFLDNAQTIFGARVDFYETLFKEMLDPAFYASHGYIPALSVAFANSVNDFIAKGGFPLRALAADYVSYYGVDFSRCYDVPLYIQWLSRYDTKAVFRYCQSISPPRYRSFEHLVYIHRLFSFMFKILSCFPDSTLSQLDIDSKRVKDNYNNS